MGAGLFEVRSHLADGKIGRILFAIVDDEMVLLHSFVKKSQSTPKSELELARRRQKDVQIMNEEKGRAGGRFADFLDEQGLRDEVESRAIRTLLAEQLKTAMVERKITKAEMARRMKTPRAHLDRLLNPEGPSITLATLQRAAAAVGRKLHVGLS